MANQVSPLRVGTALFALAMLGGCPSQPPPQAPPSPTEPEVAPAPPPPPKPAAPAPPAGLGALNQPAPQRLSNQAPALYEVGAFPLRATELRPGPEDDKHLVEIYCVGCHSTAYITMQPPLPRATWEAEVKKMRAAYGAVIPDPAADRIATYLSSYYGSNR